MEYRLSENQKIAAGEQCDSGEVNDLGTKAERSGQYRCRERGEPVLDAGSEQIASHLVVEAESVLAALRPYEHALQCEVDSKSYREPDR